MHKVFPHIKKPLGKVVAVQVSSSEANKVSVPETVQLKLSPLSRLYFTLNHELGLSKDFVWDKDRYDRFVRMQAVAERKRDHLVRSVIVLDLLAFVLLSGKGFTIPGVNINTIDIPAAREALTFLASLAFQFLALAFLNSQGYAAIIDSINAHRARETAIDPDFLSASDKFLEFFVKLYRPKMNIHGIDFVTPGGVYNFMSWCVSFLLKLSVLSFLILHLAGVFISAKETFATGSSIFVYVYFLFLIAVNVGGVLVFMSLGWSFKFEIVPNKK